MAIRKLVSAKDAISIIDDHCSLLLFSGHESICFLQQLLNKRFKKLSIFEIGHTLSVDVLNNYCNITNIITTDRERELPATSNSSICYIPYDTLSDQLYATIKGLDHIPVNLSSSAINSFPDYYQKSVSPFSSKEVTIGRSFAPDVAIFHVARADFFGNIQLNPIESFFDLQLLKLAMSAKKIIVTADQIVSSEAIELNQKYTVLPNNRVDYIIEAPYGSYPAGYNSSYKNVLIPAVELGDMLMTSQNWDSYIQSIGYLNLISVTSNRRGV